jgi:uncharacterized membrane protein
MTASTLEQELAAIPEPWSYNPSRWRQRVCICLTASVAALIAIYMGLFQWGLIDSVWDPVFGKQSERVLNSDLSHTMRRWLGIPDAVLGAIAYLGDIVLALAGSTRRWQYRPWLILLFGLDVIPLGIVSAILVVAQGFIVGSWCFLCLATAVISLALVVLAADEVWSCTLYMRGVWRESRNTRLLWDTFCGRPSEIAASVAQRMTKGTH